MPLVRLKRSAPTVRLNISDHISPERRKEIVRTRANALLKESQEVNRRALGRVPPHETFVDGRLDDRLATIKPDKGVIVFQFDLASEMFEWIEAQLILNSPIGKEPKSPEYSKSHVFFADNMQADPAAPQSGDVFVFLSSVPYARKIEGIGGRRGQSDQAPDGVYEGVAALASRRFGNLARIKFGFRSFQEGGIVMNPAISDLRRSFGRAGASQIAKAERDTRQPAIIITMN